MNNTNANKLLINLIRTKADKWMKQNNVLGSAIAIVSPNNSLNEIMSLGHYDCNRKISIEANSPFELCSVTKIFTALTFKILSIQGHINLDSSIGKFLPELTNQNIRDITIKQLIGHYSELPRDSKRDHFLEFQGPSWAEIVDYLNEYIPEPVQTTYLHNKYKYSNLGYAILGRILTNHFNKNLNDIIDETILCPLNLNNTKFLSSFNTPSFEDKIEGHDFDKNGNIRVVQNIDFRNYDSAGGLISNIEDMKKFLNFLLQPLGKLPIDAGSSVKDILSPLYVDDKWETISTFGGRYFKMNNIEFYTQNGASFGSACTTLIAPRYDIGIVILTNTLVVPFMLAKEVIEEIIAFLKLDSSKDIIETTTKKNFCEQISKLHPNVNDDIYKKVVTNIVGTYEWENSFIKEEITIDNTLDGNLVINGPSLPPLIIQTKLLPLKVTEDSTTQDLECTFLIVGGSFDGELAIYIHAQSSFKLGNMIYKKNTTVINKSLWVSNE